MRQSTIAAPERAPTISSAQMVAHEGLVRWVVRQQRLGGLSFPDALHAGRLGLWQALQHYDPTRGTRFSTYAVPAIARAVWRVVRQDEQTRAAAGAGQILPPPTPVDPVAVLEQIQVHAVLRRLVATLPPHLRLVIVAHYGLGIDPPQSFTTIGRTLGRTRQRVQQLHVDALLWLAHPAHSLPLRRLLDRATRTDYQHARRRQNQVARTRRPSRRSVP